MLPEAIQAHLSTLKLSGMLEGFAELSQAHSEPALTLLLALLKREASYRQARSFLYRLNLAKLPVLKSLDQFEGAY